VSAQAQPERPLDAASAPRPTPISAVVITYNEQDRIGDALRSVDFCDEIVVVDAGSTDATRRLAEEAGARVLVNAPWPGFVAQRRLATAAARHDWVLALDADERVSAPLRAEIEALRQRGLEGAGFVMPRVAWYLDRWIRATDWYPDHQLRLFDRRRAQWQGGLVHESVHPDIAPGRLRHELEHHSYRSVGEHLQLIERYARLWARQALAEGRRSSPLAAFAAGAFAFFRNYVLKRGLLLGGAGLVVSTLNAHYTFTKLLLLHEMGQQTTAEHRDTETQRK
jgi:glycosyltransferase involved in cell wall biosynthesis